MATKQQKTKKLEKQFGLDLEAKLSMVEKSLQAVIQGYKVSRLITGTQGIGKTFTIRKELDTEEIPYHYVSGGIDDARALYQWLYDHNAKGTIILFDDVNNILRQRKSIEILRTAVTNEEERLVTFTDNVITKKGNKIYRPQMKFKSRIIIVTNIPKAKIDKAIVSRTSPIEIIVSKDEIAEYILKNIEEAPPVILSLEKKMEVFNFIKNEITFGMCNQFDFRYFEDACLWRLAQDGTDDMEPDQWKDYVYTLLA